jgi:ribonuclease P protein component
MLPDKPIRNTFSAAEKLKSRKVLELLFEEGKAFSAYPIRLVYLEQPFDPQAPVKIATSAPKRKMKHAHDRNRTKRLLREAYRKHKHQLIDYCLSAEKSFALLFISQCNTPPEYSVVEEKLILLLKRLTPDDKKSAE